MTHEDVDTAVIGGGQAGLAAGYYLKQSGRPFVILDEHPSTGAAWRDRWDSLRLFTPGRYNGLPGVPFPGPASSYPGKDDIADYLNAYARHFEFPIRTGTRVDTLSKDSDRFLLSAHGRLIAAANVIVATGAYQTPRVPAFASGLDQRIVQLHSTAYRRPSQIQTGGVLVVGAGNSGAEIALDLVPSHQTWLSGRNPGHEPTRAGTLPDRLVTPILWFMATRVLTVTTPLGRKVRD